MSEELQQQKGINEKFCHECGATINIKAEICPKCGVRQPDIAAPGTITIAAPAGKTRMTAAILALLLGGIGSHRFYLGETVVGLIYLLFCWTFIPAIIAFIEFIIFLTMTDDSFNQKYNRL